jgi:hypothetical protein
MDFVGFGDLHFDKLDSLIPEASTLIAQSMCRVFDYALEHGVKTVIQYGDVAEKPRLSYGAQIALYRALTRKKYRELDIRFILG